MTDQRGNGALSGRRIALPETRELDRLAQMLEEHGAETLRCPMVAISDVPDPAFPEVRELAYMQGVQPEPAGGLEPPTP